MPTGIEARRVAFAGTPKPPQREYFLAGSVYALDPNIPPARQRLVVGVSGEAAAHRLLLDRHDLGLADGHPLLRPVPDAHLARLVDAGGAVVDRVLFTVR